MRGPTRAVLLSLLLGVIVGCGGDSKPKSKPTKQETLTVETTNGGGTSDAGTDSKPKGAASGDPAAATPPVMGVPTAMRRLKANDADDRARAVAVLVDAEYDPEIAGEVVAGLVPRLADTKEPIRDAAVTALGKWADADDVPLVAGVLARQQNDIRHRGIQVLGKIGGPEAAVAIADRLESAFDRELATRTLKSMGADAEPAVVTFAESRDKYVRIAVVEVLHEVGTAEGCGEELRVLVEDPEPEVATAAIRALDKVASR